MQTSWHACIRAAGEISNKAAHRYETIVIHKEEKETGLFLTINNRSTRVNIVTVELWGGYASLRCKDTYDFDSSGWNNIRKMEQVRKIDNTHEMCKQTYEFCGSVKWKLE